MIKKHQPPCISLSWQLLLLLFSITNCNMGLIIMCHHHITIFTIFCFTIFDGFVSNDCACLPPTW
ncbi:hypothetical protein ES332_A08G230400v1 [Gossypium tomentosum]|uniref:Uncharacterized protein n=1 Tax=Gossypium tomentosum TaxID=34277 RepID=A0A5D2PMK3_GOSTO|nr:hypothetical protein ES332_A08G230400v1 [Gossypium tomentosum]